jgi:uncharacterized protein
MTPMHVRLILSIFLLSLCNTLFAQGKLHKFVEKGKYDKVKKLIAEGSEDIDAQDENGKTALMIAAEKGDYKMLYFLLLKKADPNIQDKDGKTALMYASEEGNIRSVKALLRKKADIHAEDKKLRTALDYAAFENNQKIIKYLRSQGARRAFEAK